MDNELPEDYKPDTGRSIAFENMVLSPDSRK
jgi:hypothetical protein